MQITDTEAGRAAVEPYLAQHDQQAAITVLADAGRTGGALGVVVLDLRAGDTCAWYRHTGEEVAYLVLDGRVEFRLGGEAWAASPVSLVLVPRCTAHCYRALTEARLLLLAVPAGLERFVASSGAAAVDAALLLALAQEHRVEVLPDLLS